jgi:hypothetical protein
LLEDEEIAEEDEFDDPIEPGFVPVGEDLLRHFTLEGKEAENVRFYLVKNQATKYCGGNHGRDYEHVEARPDAREIAD